MVRTLIPQLHRRKRFHTPEDLTVKLIRVYDTVVSTYFVALGSLLGVPVLALMCNPWAGDAQSQVGCSDLACHSSGELGKSLHSKQDWVWLQRRMLVPRSRGPGQEWGGGWRVLHLAAVLGGPWLLPFLPMMRWEDADSGFLCSTWCKFLSFLKLRNTIDKRRTTFREP